MFLEDASPKCHPVSVFGDGRARIAQDAGMFTTDRRRVLIGLMGGACAVALGGRANAANKSRASRSFARLTALVGDWAAPLASAKSLRISMRLVAAGSVLVERYLTPSGKETLTVFHLDGDRLLATHYCGQRNQPRLRLVSDLASKSLVFTFVDATNLEPGAAHLHRLEMVVGDRNHFDKVETYRQGTKEERESLRFTRAWRLAKGG